MWTRKRKMQRGRIACDEERIAWTRAELRMPGSQPEAASSVPATAWAKVGYVIQAVLFPFQPFLGIATSAAGNLLVP